MANNYGEPLSRKLLGLAEALERHAAELEGGLGLEPLTAPTLAYRIYFRHQKIGIVGRHEFGAEDDGAALVFAGVLCDACSDVCDHFELWQGARHVGGCRHDEWTIPNARRLNAKIQATLAEHEERLLDSKWAIARSQRLLDRLRQQITP